MTVTVTSELLRSAIDYVAKKPREVKKFKRSFEVKDPVPEDCFPPCIKLIMQGIQDGKKRACSLSPFLAEVGWSSEMIEELVSEWNAKNPTPLRDAYVQGQLRAFNTSKRCPKYKNEGYCKHWTCVSLTVCVALSGHRHGTPCNECDVNKRNLINKLKSNHSTYPVVSVEDESIRSFFEEYYNMAEQNLRISFV